MRDFSSAVLIKEKVLHPIFASLSLENSLDLDFLVLILSSFFQSFFFNWFSFVCNFFRSQQTIHFGQEPAIYWHLIYVIVWILRNRIKREQLMDIETIIEHAHWNWTIFLWHERSLCYVMCSFVFRHSFQWKWSVFRHHSILHWNLISANILRLHWNIIFDN